ncbi:hypothetical protein [Demequina zhanjiangensis]|uniref:Uncharacterized protein n=1 Tax=Demequina zhanjiangensis TaxID=3051659 RepID=A0ABT8FYE4_9MICO|nr:hypothetical protein [Demequina sp. SYSU T00b26]MDN4471469.1 hypothetical protein [Demequina sp. SYSU T00b26]
MESVLDQTSPLSGDPVLLRHGAAALGAVGDALALTVAELAAAREGQGMCGTAVLAYLDAAQVIASELAAVQERYVRTATAVQRYAADLEEFQAEARALHARAVDAQRDVDAARALSDAEAIAAERRAAEDPAGLEALLVVPTAPESLAQDRLDSALAEAARCEREFAILLGLWHDASRRCAADIDIAVERSGLDDSGWDVICAGLEVLLDDVLPDLELLLDIAAVLCTVVAVALVLTGVGAGFAPALLALSRVAQAGARVVAVVRAVSTTLLVASGRRPASALVDLGVQAAVNRVGGRVTDGIAHRAGSSLSGVIASGLDRSGAGLVSVGVPGVERVGGALGAHAIDLRAHGFDEWVRRSLDPGLTGVAHASAEGAARGTNATGLTELATRSRYALDGLTWQMQDVVVEMHDEASERAGGDSQEDGA